MAYVDLSKFPEDEKPYIRDLALKHNALCGDVDKITGKTPEEKANMYQLFAVARAALSGLHSKRFNIWLASVQTGAILFILDKLGVEIQVIGRVINKFLHLLEAI